MTATEKCNQGRRSGYESGGGGRDTCQPREKFWRDKRGATERSEPSSEGGPGVLPRKISKTYMANGAIYVIPELYL